MIFAYYTKDGTAKGGLYDRYEDFYRETFSPDFDEVAELCFKVKGRTYAERKDGVRQLAIDIQTFERECPITWGELALIGSWLKTQARRYGLLREFKENGII